MVLLIPLLIQQSVLLIQCISQKKRVLLIKCQRSSLFLVLQELKPQWRSTLLNFLDVVQLSLLSTQVAKVRQPMVVMKSMKQLVNTLKMIMAIKSKTHTQLLEVVWVTSCHMFITTLTNTISSIEIKLV